METMVALLNRPIRFVFSERKGIRKINEIYGFVIEPSNNLSNNLEDYLNYIAGVSQWEYEGNSYDDLKWTSQNGEAYYSWHPYIKNYKEKARCQLNLSCRVFKTNKILDEKTPGMIDKEFIASRNLYYNILEYGFEVDVTNPGKEC